MHLSSIRLESLRLRGLGIFTAGVSILANRIRQDADGDTRQL